MSVIKTRGLRWNKQPQSPVKIDQSNPSSRGLKFNFSGKFPVNSVTGKLLIGVPVVSAGLDGIASKFNGSTTGLSDTSSPQIATYPFAMAARAFVSDFTTTGTFVGLGTATSGHYATLDLSGTEVGDPIRVLSASGANYKIFYYPTVTADTWYTFLAIFDTATSYRLFINGTQITETSSVGAGTPAPTFTSYDVGQSVQSTAANRLTGGVLWAKVWDRVPSISEIADIGNLPWQVSTPKKRNIWVGVAGGGITAALTGQLLSVGQGSVTANVSTAITGQLISVGQGNVSTGIIGQLISVGQGTVTANISTALTGQLVSIGQGNISIGLTGQLLSVGQGSVTAIIITPITGQFISVAQGSVTAVNGGDPISNSLDGMYRRRRRL